MQLRATGYERSATSYKLRATSVGAEYFPPGYTHENIHENTHENTHHFKF